MAAAAPAEAALSDASVTISVAVFPLPKAEVERIIKSKAEGEYERLRGTPGFVLEPLPWDRLTELVKANTEVSLGELGRHPAAVAVYWDFRSGVLKKFCSMGDFAKIRMLGCAPVLGPDGLVRAEPRPTEALSPEAPDACSEPYISWLLNDFPYNVEEGVEHHNMWSSQPLSQERLVQEIEKRRVGWDFCHFVNPASLASIPAIWHAHILSRRPPEEAGRAG